MHNTVQEALQSQSSEALPAFGFGHTHHARQWPASNRFTTGTVFMRLPMRTLMTQTPQYLGRLFGVNRAALIGFRDRDHGLRSPAHGSALRWVDETLLASGIHDCTGAVTLYAFPAVLGYAFKPVSFWFCENQEGELCAVLVEVNNTFGEHHHYVLRCGDGLPLSNAAGGSTAGDSRLQVDKAFHVSPFFPVRGRYAFSWNTQALRTLLRIDYFDALHRPERPDEVSLVTTISGQHHTITTSTCLRALLSYPLQALTVVLRIHWQAAKLWFKRVPFYSKPAR